VVPLFRQQAKAGIITITDERMTRFWISLDQAVDLVLWAVEHMRGGEIFVPKIPSVRVIDVAEAIAPGVPRAIVGIRPGEKLHELLVTSDESRHTVDAGDLYVTLPEHPWWEAGGLVAAGKALPDGFVYSSDQNDRWLDVAELREALA
jgi:UDP-N-acetylglucosamine 4,6-dehydratase